MLRHEFSKKSLQHTLEVRARQVEDCTRRRIAALREDAAWAESEAFEGFKAEMAGVAEARKRADDKHEVERTLDAQMRDNMRRRTKEAARDAEELEAVRRVQAGRDAALAKREADAAAAERALAAEIRSYNEYGPGTRWMHVVSLAGRHPLWCSAAREWLSLLLDPCSCAGELWWT